MKTESTKTILVITVGMLVVFMTTQWRPALILSMLIGVVGILSKYLAIKIDFLWMKLTWVLSLIVPNVLLSIVFYLMLTPLAILFRVFSRKNELFLKNTSPSLFKEYNKTFDKESFKNPW
ncbi:hypothetical protein N9528_02280 [Crocinitomicaceae bacterium]|nr:hypothetical protein [Crocinitomicaceae bacterium]